MELSSIIFLGFLLFLLASVLIELWLDIRNINYIKKHIHSVPQFFINKISIEDHQKAANYSITKTKVGFLFEHINLIITLAWLFIGFNALDLWIRSFSNIESEIIRGLVFFGIFSLISTIISLPESIYSTFVTEKKFGFNKTTPKLFVMDLFKGLILGALIGAPIIAAVLWIILSLGNMWWLYAWVFLMSVQIILLWAYPALIAPLFNKFTVLQDGELKDTILKLLERTGFKSNGLFVMDASKRSTHGNAYFTGIGKNKRIVFFDTLINSLTTTEVEAVLAHELGHFKKKHILKMIITAACFSLIGFFVLGYLYSSLDFFAAFNVKNQSSYMALILFSTIAPVFTFFITPISAYFSRKKEFEADNFAKEYSNSESLISALVKMYKDNASTLTPDPIYSAFHHSHPPAMVRIENLKKQM